MKKSVLASIGMMLLTVAFSLGAPTQVSAHSREVSTTCRSVDVVVESYTADDVGEAPNIVTVSIDGVEVSQEPFVENYVKSFPLPGTGHSYVVKIVAIDDPTGSNGWTMSYEGTTQECPAPLPQNKVEYRRWVQRAVTCEGAPGDKLARSRDATSFPYDYEPSGESVETRTESSDDLEDEVTHGGIDSLGCTVSRSPDKIESVEQKVTAVTCEPVQGDTGELADYAYAHGTKGESVEMPTGGTENFKAGVAQERTDGVVCSTPQPAPLGIVSVSPSPLPETGTNARMLLAAGMIVAVLVGATLLVLNRMPHRG